MEDSLSVESKTDQSSLHWVSVVVVLVGLAVLVWVVVRNEPFRDTMAPQVIRVFLCIAAGSAALILPGYLGIDFGAEGQRISGAGAIGFAVLTFLGTPYVAPALDPSNVQVDPPRSIPATTWESSEFLRSLPSAADLTARYEGRRVAWVSKLIGDAEHGKWFIVESTPFERPYNGFNVALQTVPTHNGRVHDVSAFLVRGETKSFEPLYHFYATQLYNQPIIHVPPAAADDYLLIVLTLNSEKSYSSGRTLPLQLYTL